MSLFWNGHVTETTARVVVQSDVTGTVSVNGAQAAADTAVDDGIVVVTLTGLSAGRAYPYTVTVAGEVIGSGEVRTAPAAGQPFSMVFFSCLEHSFNWHWPDIHRDHDVRAVVALGDWPYIDAPYDGSARSYWGQPAVQGLSFFLRDNPGATVAQQRANYWAHCKQARAMYGMRGLLTHAAVYAAMDDHEYIGNNYPYTAGTVGGLGANTYADLFANDAAAAAFANLCEDWIAAYWRGHPANVDAGADLTKPWLYYRARIGDVEFWVTNLIRYNDQSTTQLGTRQRQWLIDTIQSSTAPYKLWALTPGHVGFSDVPAELDTVLAAVAGHGLTAAIVGDWHIPHVSQRGGLTFVNTSPVGQGVNLTPLTPGVNDTVWRSGASASASALFFNCARVDVSAHQLRVALVDSFGNERWTRAWRPNGGGQVVTRAKV